MKKDRTILIIAEISILSAFALVLDYVANLLNFSLFPNGGSISITMLPIMVVAFRRGPLAGMISGFVVGMIQVIWGGYILQIFQYLLDYPIAYTVVGLASVFVYTNKSKKITKFNLILGGFFAGLLRYLSHFLAGIIFWTEYVPDDFNAFTWSLYYNGSYMIPSIILTVIILYIIYIYAKYIFVIDDINSKFIN